MWQHVAAATRCPHSVWSLGFASSLSSRGVVAMNLEAQLKLALDETRLLILGAQVLFGFQFQAVFQEGFRHLPATAQRVQCAGLLFLLIAIAFLIAPSMEHQIVYQGESRRDAIGMATRYSTASLLPLALGLGASVYVVFAEVMGHGAGLIAGLALTLVAIVLLYGLGAVLRTGRPVMSADQTATSVKTKIEQLLTEARVIIPGGQALLGFQLVASLTPTFAALPFSVKLVHLMGLCAVALAVVLLMTPAALHRIAYHGEDNAAFYDIGSWLVIGSTVPLALGIASDVYVVFYVVFLSRALAMGAGVTSFITLLTFWIFYPMWQRMPWHLGASS